MVRREIQVTRQLAIATGESYPEFAEKVAAHIGVELTQTEFTRYPIGERGVRYVDNVRGKELFLIQSHVSGPDLSFDGSMTQHRLMLDAAKRSSVKHATVVAPFFGYARQDTKTESGRDAIGCKEEISSFESAGGESLRGFMSVDLHAGQVQGFTNKPFDHLTALDLLAETVFDYIDDPSEAVVVAPNAGRMKIAEKLQTILEANLAYRAVMKQRGVDGMARKEVPYLLGDVSGRDCVIVDDMFDTGNNAAMTAAMLKDNGAKTIIGLATHGIFSLGAADRIKRSPIDTVIVTDTLPQDRTQAILGDRLRVISIAPLVGNGIMAIFHNQSVSALSPTGNLS